MRCAAEVREHALQLLLHLFHARRRHDLHAGRNGAQLEFDFALVELPSRSILRNFWRVSLIARRWLGRPWRSPSSSGCGSSASSTRSSAASAARSRTLAISSSRVIFTATSTRSLTMESTSRPT